MNSAIQPSKTKIDDGRGHSLEMAKQIDLVGGGVKSIKFEKKINDENTFPNCCRYV